jgi:hypothetical protein
MNFFIEEDSNVLGWWMLWVEPWLESMGRTQAPLCGSLSNVFAVLNQIARRAMKPDRPNATGWLADFELRAGKR